MEGTSLQRRRRGEETEKEDIGKKEKQSKSLEGCADRLEV